MKKILLALALFIAPFACAQTSQLHSVTLAWDPNPEPDIASYVIYFGTGSRTYSYATNVGNFSTAAVRGLEAGRTYFFAVTAVNTSGLESDFSIEVTNTIPLLVTLPPRNVLIRSGLEEAPSLEGPWREILATEIPVTPQSNMFYRPKVFRHLLPPE